MTANDEKEKIRKWLNAPDCTINMQVAADKRAEGTCQWILNHPAYVEWKQSPNILWIQGKGIDESCTQYNELFADNSLKLDQARLF